MRYTESTKKSSALIVRSPFAPTATIWAFNAMIAAGQSPAGSEWATLPPIVPFVSDLHVADV